MSKDEKRDRKSILKTPEQKPKQPSDRRKSAHWDEDNIHDTLHPEGKDYGLMKIDEPKTPFNWEKDANAPSTSKGKQGVDAAELKQKLEKELSMDQEAEKRKKDFEQKRKAHYDEFRQLKKASALLKSSKEYDEDDGLETAENKQTKETKGSEKDSKKKDQKDSQKKGFKTK